MTNETPNVISESNSTPEAQVDVNVSAAQTGTTETVEGMSTESISKLTDDELNAKLDGEPPVPKEEKPPAEESEVAKLKKQWEDSQAMIRRQAAELGELRKLQQAALAPKEPTPPAPEKISADELSALLLEDPRKAMEIIESEKAHQEAIRRSELNTRTETLKAMAPDLADNAATIAKIMKEFDGFTDEQIIHIANNIDKIPPDVLYNYNQRAKIYNENVALKAEMEKLKGKPDRLLSKIEAAQKPNMTSSSGQSNPAGQTNGRNAAEMSDKELNEALKRSGIN